MSEKDNIKVSIDEIYSSPPRRKFPTNKIKYNHIDGIWSLDLAEFLDYNTSKNKGYRYKFIIINNFSNYLWAIPLQIKYSKTIKEEFSNILTTSKRKPLKLESARGTEFYNSFFQNCLHIKIYNIIHDLPIKVHQ